MAGNINRVIITGNLTKDPELKAFPESGNSVCSLRIACNGRRKNNETGQWEDAPNFFDVSVFGQQGENCKRYLSKGRAGDRWAPSLAGMDRPRRAEAAKCRYHRRDRAVPRRPRRRG